MLLVCKNICKSFGNQKVLKGLNFAVQAGEVVAIVGASGAGKTTLLQILGTILTPDGGELLFEGQDILKFTPRQLAEFRNQSVGFVFQFHHLLPEFTALENVMMPALIARELKINQLQMNQIRTRAKQLLNELGLNGKEDSFPPNLSGGEAQRVAIARGMMNQPKILFADEPSGNLDSRTKEELHSLFFKMRELHNTTIVIVTHDKTLAQRCDRELELVDGEFK